jgi:AcrR family transcriptional regulator
MPTTSQIPKKPMSEKHRLRDALVTETIKAISIQGLESLSLRNVSAAAGCSTGVVFQNFGGKEELIAAALEKALSGEKKFHDDFSSHTDAVAFHHLSFADLVASYVELRAESVCARFWTEILFKSQQLVSAPLYISQWHSLRVEFWQAKLSQSACDPALAPILSAYCSMEEVYAYSLIGHPEYRLLLRETTRALTAKGFGVQLSDYHCDISEWLGQGSPRFQVPTQPDRNELSQRLLDLAAKHIVSKGIGSLNQRKIAKEAKTSSSMIAYHFGNLDTFVNEAIWRALLINIPNEVNPAIAGGQKQKNVAEWSAVLSILITRPRTKVKRAGFYINVARITGEVSLLARQRLELLPIVDHLRNFEGSGSFRASKSIWPDAISLDRSTATAFGVWIKGQAVLNETLSAAEQDSRAQLLDAAALLLGNR